MPAMPTTFRDAIRETVSPHKFGGSRHAAMLYVLSLDSSYDESTGSVEWYVWAARFGRHLLYEDSQGFVYSDRRDTVQEAAAIFASLDAEYAEWDDAGE